MLYHNLTYQYVLLFSLSALVDNEVFIGQHNPKPLNRKVTSNNLNNEKNETCV